MPEPITPRVKFKIDDGSAEDRLAELILYISEKCSDDDSFGATKLNKILFFSDFISYQSEGRPITGVEYMRLPRGPAPRRLIPVRDRLEETGALVVKTQKFYQHEQHRTISIREPNLELFKPQDIAIVDEVIRLLWGKTAGQVSHLSHGDAWHFAPEDGSIPYEASFLSDEPLTEDDMARARELARELAREDGSELQD